jgi:hypothetical protein
MSAECVSAEIDLSVFLKEVSNLNYGILTEFGWQDEGYSGFVGKCGASEVKLDYETQKALVVASPDPGRCAECFLKNHCSSSLAASQIITKFCQGCDNFDSDKISCKLVGQVNQAIYANRGVCYQASVNGLETTKTLN